VLLRWAFGHEEVAGSSILLDRWEITRIKRVLPTALQGALSTSASGVRPGEVADQIAGALGDGHPLYEFFMVASVHGGFAVERV
jgi:hypothetical protein